MQRIKSIVIFSLVVLMVGTVFVSAFDFLPFPRPSRGNFGLPISLPILATECNDGIDNDGDTFADYPADPGCSSASDDDERNYEIACDDGVDNDGDGLNNYPEDPECDSPADISEANCMETDGGWDDIYTQGTVSGSVAGIPYSETDFCLDVTMLREYYCAGAGYRQRDVNCVIPPNATGTGSTMCDMGACV